MCGDDLPRRFDEGGGRGGEEFWDEQHPAYFESEPSHTITAQKNEGTGECT